MTNKIALITGAEAGAGISPDTDCLGALCETVRSVERVSARPTSSERPRKCRREKRYA